MTSTPRAPLMEVSSRGLETARRAASSALFLPEARPTPMWAMPASFMTADTSAKSRLINPVFLIRSEMDCTAWRSTSSATSKALARVIFCSVTNFSRSLGMITRESTLVRRFSMPSSACCIRRRPSKEKGLVTTPTVRMSISLDRSARMGAAPVPVPPPMPAVINTMSVPSRALEIWVRLSSADWRPTSGLEPAPWPSVSFSPI